MHKTKGRIERNRSNDNGSMMVGVEWMERRSRMAKASWASWVYDAMVRTQIEGGDNCQCYEKDITKRNKESKEKDTFVGNSA